MNCASCQLGWVRDELTHKRRNNYDIISIIGKCETIMVHTAYITVRRGCRTPGPRTCWQNYIMSRVASWSSRTEKVQRLAQQAEVWLLVFYQRCHLQAWVCRRTAHQEQLVSATIKSKIVLNSQHDDMGLNMHTQTHDALTSTGNMAVRNKYIDFGQARQRAVVCCSYNSTVARLRHYFDAGIVRNACLRSMYSD